MPRWASPCSPWRHRSQSHSQKKKKSFAKPFAESPFPDSVHSPEGARPGPHPSTAAALSALSSFEHYRGGAGLRSGGTLSTHGPPTSTPWTCGSPPPAWSARTLPPETPRGCSAAGIPAYSPGVYSANVGGAYTAGLRHLSPDQVVRVHSAVTEGLRRLESSRGGGTEPRGAIVEPRGAIVEPERAIVEPRGAIAEPRGAIAEPRGRTPLLGPGDATVAEPSKPVVATVAPIKSATDSEALAQVSTGHAGLAHREPELPPPTTGTHRRSLEWARAERDRILSASN